MMKKIKQVLALTVVTAVVLGEFFSDSVTAFAMDGESTDQPIVLRVCNWEEYIDEGDWEDDEVIDLDSGDIFGENSLVDDFEDWYLETYGRKVDVEYSCFGTNEELYNMLTIGDEYDLVCPSDYMIMKLMSEDWLEPFSQNFFDEEDENNYYVKGVSPYIRDVFDENEINGESWSKYAAGYMWGVTGIIYNPDEVSREDASTWHIFDNEDVYRRITIKDNVRDSMFAAVGAVKSDKLTDPSFIADPDYQSLLMDEMNDVSEETVLAVQDYLQKAKNNLYSFETDSGKADMITGKVVANYQWSGDAVYAMDQAEEDDFYLEFAVPEESTNLWFDGWVMLKEGIGNDPAKKQAAEAFVNFLSMPENAVRNMYYIGYTSVISGGDDDRVYEYLEWNYAAEDDEEDVVDYPVGYFFSGDPEDEDYVLTVPEEQTRRQLYAQYPTSDVIDRSAVMWYFDSDANARINRMWINVRCFNAKNIPVPVFVVVGALLAGVLFIMIRTRLKNRDTGRQ